MPHGRPLSFLSLFLLISLNAAEVPVTAPVTGPAPFQRFRPRIASDGRGFLAIWNDGRAGAAPQTDVRGRFVEGGGDIVIKPLGSVVGDVASNGDGYLVATVANGATEISSVSASGEVKDVARVAGGTSPALASNGRDYLLVYQVASGPAIEQTDVFAQRLNADGTPRGERLRIAVGAIDPVVASNGSEYAISTFDVTGNYATILGHDGIRVPRVQLTAQGLQPYLGQDKMSVASDGTDFLFVWAEGRGVLNGSTWRTQTFVRRLRVNGEVDDVKQFFPDEAPVQGQPSIVWMGDRYLVTFTSNLQRTDPDLAAVELARDGTRLGEPFTLVGDSDRQTMSDVAWNGRDAEVVYVDTVRFAITGPGTKSDDIRHIRYGAPPSALLSESLAWQGAPAAVASGDADLVVWNEQVGREHRWTVFAGRAHPATGPLDGRGVALQSSTDDQIRPILSDAPQPLAVWLDQPLFSNAQVAAKLPFGTADAALLGEAWRDAQPAAAWNGSLHLVIWESPSFAIVGVRVTADGRRLDATPIRISPPGVFAIEPQLVWSGERYLVSWIALEEDKDCVILCPALRSLDVTAFDASLNPLAPPSRLASGNITRGRLVWNGSEFAIFFAGPERTPSGPSRSGLRATRVDRNGIPLDPVGRILAAAGI
ncbi:MAG TPA: hypothetical protein VJ276_26295, partial [Thermoanaerobaculia bacterium]|nr:hypothetical protein [Thermoanaerobaculia bacterium]